MKQARIYYFFLTIFIVTACAPRVIPVERTDVENDPIGAQTSVDSSLMSFIAPYKSELNAEMNEKLAYISRPMTHEGRNSQIGHWICDILLDRGQQLFPDREIDAAFYNPGGIRISFIDTGWITKGNIYELVPFDNYLVVLEMKGKDVKTLCDHMAERGGWPVSEGWEFTIFDEKSQYIKMHGRELEEEKTYQILTNDYIANGGDACDFLVPLPQQSSGQLVREILINYLRNLEVEVDYAPKRRIELMMR